MVVWTMGVVALAQVVRVVGKKLNEGMRQMAMLIVTIGIVLV